MTRIVFFLNTRKKGENKGKELEEKIRDEVLGL